MIREAGFEEISDGRRYTSRDMVRADCQDCKGCSACCHGMGDSIVLDPYDAWRLERGLGSPFAALLNTTVGLHVEGGVILPHLAMSGEDERCGYLNGVGRCSIHAVRPGICRLFPLGRIYEDGAFSYFLQVNECRNRHRSKVRVGKWIDTPDVERYERFVLEWHDLIRDLQQLLAERQDEAFAKALNMKLLTAFYLQGWQTEDFYGEFARRKNVLDFFGGRD